MKNGEALKVTEWRQLRMDPLVYDKYVLFNWYDGVQLYQLGGKLLAF